MTMLERFRERMAAEKAAANCKIGRHRWTCIVEKFEDGSRLEWNVCQTCGERDEPEALEGKGNGL